eukprot:GFYU01000556.1.p1 GENE.GFYU01000556.1~~GFYU01000556.1.p1  ORF type:complete len:791 (-),score=102.07 GFYU01000556.1:196-2568(-)
MRIGANFESFAAFSMAYLAFALASASGEGGSFRALLYTMLEVKTYLVSVILAGYTILFGFAKIIQTIFFGKLRVIENQLLYDRMLQYALFKIVFIGAVLQPDVKEILVWTTWFSILGFLKIFTLLCRDRFEYLTFSPTTPMRTHSKMIGLLLTIGFSDMFWFSVCVFLFHEAGVSVLLLLLFECVSVFLHTCQTLIKYIIHLVDLSREGVWEQRGTYLYYTELATDVLNLTLTLSHYVHIWSLHGISFTLIDAVLFLHMRTVFNNLKKKLLQFKNYRRATSDMDSKVPDATEEDLLAFNDDCAICRDKMTHAKKLLCGHLFHLSCLRSWLEHHHSCPTCRRSILDDTPVSNTRNNGDAGTTAENAPGDTTGATGNQTADGTGTPTTAADGDPDAEADPQTRLANARAFQEESLFSFNSNRWRWLPHFSFEVVRRSGATQGGAAASTNPTPTAAPSEELIRQVQEILPHVPLDVITRDLVMTNSAEESIERLLDYTPPATSADTPDGELPPQPTTTPVTTTTTTTEPTVTVNEARNDSTPVGRTSTSQSEPTLLSPIPVQSQETPAEEGDKTEANTTPAQSSSSDAMASILRRSTSFGDRSPPVNMHSSVLPPPLSLPIPLSMSSPSMVNRASSIREDEPQSQSSSQSTDAPTTTPPAQPPPLTYPNTVELPPMDPCIAPGTPPVANNIWSQPMPYPERKAMLFEAVRKRYLAKQEYKRAVEKAQQAAAPVPSSSAAASDTLPPVEPSPQSTSQSGSSVQETSAQDIQARRQRALEAIERRMNTSDNVDNN